MKEIGLPEITEEQCREYVGNGAKVLIEKTLRASGDTGLVHSMMRLLRISGFLMRTACTM